MTTPQPSHLAEVGQRVIENNAQNSSAFMQMRAKPPAPKFSAKALSFYSNDVMAKYGKNGPILVANADKAPYSTYD